MIPSHCLTGHVTKKLPVKDVVVCGSQRAGMSLDVAHSSTSVGSSGKHYLQSNDVTGEDADKYLFYFNN